MSMQDPISDMLTSIRNGQSADKISVVVPSSTLKVSISDVLRNEGYIKNYLVRRDGNKSFLTIILKYFRGKSVIENIIRVSKPSLRVYRKKNNLPIVMDGLGIAIMSTSHGVISNKTAKKLGIGGEVICFVS